MSLFFLFWSPRFYLLSNFIYILIFVEIFINSPLRILFTLRNNWRERFYTNNEIHFNFKCLISSLSLRSSKHCLFHKCLINSVKKFKYTKISYFMHNYHDMLCSYIMLNNKVYIKSINWNSLNQIISISTICHLLYLFRQHPQRRGRDTQKIFVKKNIQNKIIINKYIWSFYDP